jgi:transposase
MTYSRFLELFPSSDACLDYLKERFYPDGSDCPKCGKQTKFHRLKSRAAYSCQYCRHQVYPTSGTIFNKSTTSLQLWFWAIYLMSSTRCGISAKQLEREIGVTYKTAHRMFKQIRSLLCDEDDEPLDGKVEVDETAYGGKPRVGQVQGRKGSREWGNQKETVLGMVERRGRVRAKIVPDRQAATLGGTMRQHILPSAMVFTDELPAYISPGMDYRGHHRIKHLERIYVDGDVHTQTIEGFFGLLKNGIRGVYHAVSRRYLQSYLDEYAFRYNQRDSAQPMFWTILDRVRKVSAA